MSHYVPLLEQNPFVKLLIVAAVLAPVIWW